MTQESSHRVVVLVDDGDILTAAGSAAALDLGLHVVRRDHGAEIANAVSRRLVFAAHRDGGQRQFVERPIPAVQDQSLAPLLAWAQETATAHSRWPTWQPRRQSARRRCTAGSAPNWAQPHWPGSPEKG